MSKRQAEHNPFEVHDTTILLDFNRDGKKDTFLIKKDKDCADCIGKLVAKITGLKDTIILERDTTDPIVYFSLGNGDESFIKKNLIHSYEAAFVKVGKAPNDAICFYASYNFSSEELMRQLYFVNDSNKLVLLFSSVSDSFELVDMNHDGNNMIAADMGKWGGLETSFGGRESGFYDPTGGANFNSRFDNPKGGYVESYHPFTIFKLTAQKQLKPDTALSIKYTKKHNHGYWGGFQAGDSVLLKLTKNSPVKFLETKQAAKQWNKLYGK